MGLSDINCTIYVGWWWNRQFCLWILARCRRARNTWLPSRTCVLDRYGRWHAALGRICIYGYRWQRIQRYVDCGRLSFTLICILLFVFIVSRCALSLMHVNSCKSFFVSSTACVKGVTCSEHGLCISSSGPCDCAPGFIGTQCNMCSDSSYGYPNCTCESISI